MRRGRRTTFGRLCREGREVSDLSQQQRGHHSKSAFSVRPCVCVWVCGCVGVYVCMCVGVHVHAIRVVRACGSLFAKWHGSCVLRCPFVLARCFDPPPRTPHPSPSFATFHSLHTPQIERRGVHTRRRHQREAPQQTRSRGRSRLRQHLTRRPGWCGGGHLRAHHGEGRQGAHAVARQRPQLSCWRRRGTWRRRAEVCAAGSTQEGDGDGVDEQRGEEKACWCRQWRW